MRSPFDSSGSRDFPVTTKALVPWIVFGIFVVYVAAPALPRPAGPGSGFDVTAFGRLPVSANGRVQPFDSVARTGLLQIRGPETAGPAMIDPTVWLLEVLAKPDTAGNGRGFPLNRRGALREMQVQGGGP